MADRVSGLTEALGQVSNLRDQLDGLLEQLEKMKGKLKGHEPAHVIPADVEKQIKELMVGIASCPGSLNNFFGRPRNEAFIDHSNVCVCRY